MTKKILLGWGISILLISLFAGCGSKSVDVMNYTHIEFSGLNGNGEAKVTFDTDLEKEVLHAAGYKEGDDPFAFLDLLALYSYEVSPLNGLSNGDKISLTIKPEKTILAKYKLTVKPLEKQFTVEGLKDGVEIDLFKDVELVLEGVSPFLKVSARSTSNDAFLASVRYNIKDSHDYKIGDEAVIIANYDKTTAEKKGYLFKENEKKFVIDNADKYMDSLDQLGDQLNKRIITEAQDKAVEIFARHGGSVCYIVSGKAVYNLYEKSNTYSNPICMDMLLLAPKSDMSNSSISSTIYVTAKVTVTGKDSTQDDILVAVKVPQIIIRADGTQTADFTKLDYYYYKNTKVSDDIFNKFIDENKSKCTSQIKPIYSNILADSDNDKSSESGATGIIYYSQEDSGLDEEYISSIVLNDDGTFLFVVNLLSSMGKMEGTFTKGETDISCVVINKNFSGTFVGSDLESFIFSIDGNRLKISSQKKPEGVIVGGVFEGSVFVQTDKEPLSIEKYGR